MSKKYYETCRSNSGDYERYETKRDALRAAQKIANTYQETVFIDVWSGDDNDECPGYIVVEPK